MQVLSSRGRSRHGRRATTSVAMAALVLSPLHGTASAADTPLAAITAARDDLARVSPSDRTDSKRINEAIADLDAATAPAVWVDADTLDVDNGLRAHRRLEHAVTSLSKVRGTDMTSMLTRLATAADGIAHAAITDADTAIARAEGGNRDKLGTARHHRAKSEERDTDAETHAARGDHRLAVSDWTKSWHDAQKAIAQANASCADADCTPSQDPDALRANALVCGSSLRSVAASYPTGTTFTTSSGCAPDADTQVLFVMRSGASQAASRSTAWTEYVRTGGIIITELGASNEVFSAVFEPVTEGAFRGQCMDNVMPVAKHNRTDSVWTSNELQTTSTNTSGCGFDLSHYPGITPLGGWSATDVSLARRDLGDGRVWLVEADWADTDGAWSPASNTLLGHLITHRR